MTRREQRVLVVDDHLPVRVLLTRMLNKWGYPVKHVGSAAEALDAMALDPADIMLCDVNMPDVDGVSLAREVHARWPDTAIIMSTGYDDAVTVHTSRQVGAVGYITKPFVPYLIRDALDRVGSVPQEPPAQKE